MGKKSSEKSPTRSRERQEGWRRHLEKKMPDFRALSSEMYEARADHRRAGLPPQWFDLVSHMQERVREASDNELREQSSDGNEDESQDSPAAVRGFEWSKEITELHEMLWCVFDAIAVDIELPRGASLASIMLVSHALAFVKNELEGGTKGYRYDAEERCVRVASATKALSPEYDDPNMRKLRAMQLADFAAYWIHVPSDAEVEEAVERYKALDGHDVDRHRDFVAIGKPLSGAQVAHEELVDLDPAFATLDPLVVLEEWSEARADSDGGKDGKGDGRMGPVRALARLSVMCGAFGFVVRPGETFDEAVDRTRANLLMTRSRFRKAVQEFDAGLRQSTEHKEIA